MNKPPVTMLKLRRRTKWEAIDSGIILLQGNIAPAAVLGAIVVFSCAFPARMLFTARPWLAWLMVWWLKPLYERVVLHVISQRYFDISIPTGAILKTLFSTVSRGLPGTLLHKRLNPPRSSRAPVQALEKLKGARLRERIRILVRGGLDFGTMLTFLCLCIETGLLLAELLFLVSVASIFRPELIHIASEIALNSEPWIFWLWCLNILGISLLYASTGFSLYLNSRVEVEGWDLQILFTRYAQEREKKAKAQHRSGRGGTIKSLVFIVFLALAARNPLQAEETGLPEYVSADIPADTLQKVLSSPDFGHTKKTFSLVPKKKKDNASRPPLSLDFGDNWLGVRNVLGGILIAVISLVLAGSIGYLVYMAVRHRKQKTAENKEESAAVPVIEEKPPSPEEYIGLARTEASEGRLREAWALCVRAVIDSCSEVDGGRPDMTELECLYRYKSSVEGLGSFIHEWIAIAYAGGDTDSEGTEKAITFGMSLVGTSERNA